MTETLVREIRLLIADDHRVLLDGLSSLLAAEPGFQIVGTAETGRQAVELLQRVECDVCLLDISMPELDGIQTAEWIGRHKPEIRIIILTTHDEEEIIAEMIRSGVHGYLLKSSTRLELVTAIRRVMDGKSHFSDAVHDAVFSGYARELGKRAPETSPVQLTTREKEIVQLLAREYTNEKIAGALHISFRTVETHRKNIMQKTKARNLAGLLKFAVNQGIIERF